MPEFQSVPITNDFYIEIFPERPKLDLTPEDTRKIETIWRTESALRPDELFNGLILSVMEFDRNRAIGFFTEYKYLLAQYREPALKKVLNITPVCVRAATFAGGHILFGRRSAKVTLFPRAFECVPAGGIDPESVKESRIDISAQLYQELEEEARIKNPLSCRLFSLIHDSAENIFEICAEIQVPEKAASKTPLTNKEHTHFDWIKKENLREFCNSPTRAFVPTTQWILSALHLL